MSEILKLAIKCDKQRDIYEKINQQHIDELNRAYELAMACLNLKRQSSLNKNEYCVKQLQHQYRSNSRNRNRIRFTRSRYIRRTLQNAFKI